MNNGSLILSLADCHDVKLVGGKAINLAKLINGGFPVPNGFAVTTDAYRLFRSGDSASMPSELVETITRAYRGMGAPTVAVRSSATAEDMADASMAGQYETILDVSGTEALIAAILKCWASLDSKRVRSYLIQHHIDVSQVAMGVIVQELVPADIAGVLFTENPRLGARGEMLIEASWGLGESVVSGIVQPDTLVLDRATGMVKQAIIADKQVWIQPGSNAVQPVLEGLRRKPTLSSQQVRELWRLGTRVMEYYGSPQDTEWAIYQNKLFLLQARSITTLENAATYASCLQKARGQLLASKAAGRGDWVLHNLAETLPQPTPLTWSVIKRFMTGDGGFGKMYQSIGFTPSESVKEEGFLELIAGKIYTDLSLSPQMFFADFPYSYDLALLRANPDAAQGPPTIPGGSLRSRFRNSRRLANVNRRLEVLSEEYDQHLQNQWIPKFVAWVEDEKRHKLQQLTTDQWLDVWRERENRVMDEFAPQSLMPSLICAMALSQLRTFVSENFWDEEPDALVNLFAAAADPDRTVRATAALLELSEGMGSIEEWIAANGHRAPEEFDLATPRWSERPDAVLTMAGHLKGSISALVLHRQRAETAQKSIDEFTECLTATDQAEFRRRLNLVHRYLPFRENGKHFLMLGYKLLRDAALDAGRRLDFDQPNDVFLLSLEELTDALRIGYAPLHTIEQRRVDRMAAERVKLPLLITGADIPKLGEPREIATGNRISVFPISAGYCRGPVRIVTKPESAGDLGSGYVLVCTSTDPSWTPLFVKAGGVIMERGGTLSHGAVVAREMGIPAVVLESATSTFKEGEIIAVDGHHGTLIRGDAEGEQATPEIIDANNTHIEQKMMPPPVGRNERRAAKLRNAFLGFWGLLLFAAFLLPEYLIKQPIFTLFDLILFPVLRSIGRPATVAVVAAALATFTMLGQLFFTDNYRLVIAKRRAAGLRRSALMLPPDSPRRNAMLACAAPIPIRVALAAFVPLAFVLGPMVMSFLWFPQRMDPLGWNAPPGTTVLVTALVDGDWRKSITLDSGALIVDESTPKAQSLPPIRATLERQLVEWQQPSKLPDNTPWELREAAETIRQKKIESLGAYLKRPIPLQPLSWVLRTPANREEAFPLGLRAEGLSTIVTYAVLGRNLPPLAKTDLGDGKGPVQYVKVSEPASPIQSIRVTYREQKKEGADTFWGPVDKLHSMMGKPTWLAPWLMIYLIVYIPFMLFWKWMLGIA